MAHVFSHLRKPHAWLVGRCSLFIVRRVDQRATNNALLLLLLLPLLTACEKEIEVDLPVTEPKIVVEGTIQTGQPPLVLITRTQSYFASTSTESLASIFVSDAVVTVNDGNGPIVLDRICSSQLTEEQLEQASAATGIDLDILTAADICIWTKLDNSLLGVEGRAYALDIVAEGKALSARSTIPHAVALDSTWFKLAEQNVGDDSLGFVWATLTDPDTMGNAYRWLARRINQDDDGEAKDGSFIAPLFSVFEDRYVNGLTFDFAYNRGSLPYSTAEDDNNAEGGYFKRGDTVVVKLASMGQDEYRFYNSFANNVASQGDLFSNPSNIRSNIVGGLGIWAGWGIRLDTVVCVP